MSVETALRLLKGFFSDKIEAPDNDGAMPVPARDHMKRGDLPPLDTFLKQCPIGYLEFLGMNHPALPQTVTALSSVVQSIDDRHGFVDRLLEDSNWRSHVIACAVVLLSRDAASYAATLWRTLDHGSWVTPQLAATLCLTDPEFARQAKRRVTERCGFFESTDLTRQARASKNLASLVGILRTVADEGDWLAPQLAQPELRSVLERDRDDADAIAIAWINAVREHADLFVRT